MQTVDLDGWIKYLGFHLKHNIYRFEDWYWLYNKLEAKISVWCNR